MAALETEPQHRLPVHELVAARSGTPSSGATGRFSYAAPRWLAVDERGTRDAGQCDLIRSCGSTRVTNLSGRPRPWSTAPTGPIVTDTSVEQQRHRPPFMKLVTAPCENTIEQGCRKARYRPARRSHVDHSTARHEYDPCTHGYHMDTPERARRLTDSNGESLRSTRLRRCTPYDMLCTCEK